MIESTVDDDDDDDLNEEAVDADQQRTMMDMDASISTVHSDSDKIDSLLIKKILNEMKSEFTKGTPAKINDNSDFNDENNDNRSNDNEDEENEDDPKPAVALPEHFQRIKVSDIIGLRKFESQVDCIDKDDKESDITFGNCSGSENVNANVEGTITEVQVENNSLKSSDVSSKLKEIVVEVDGNDKSNKTEKVDNEEDNGCDMIQKSNVIISSPQKRNIEKKTVPNQDLIITEPRRKRSLRNQSVINEEPEEESISLKRSSRRFSKEYKRESVLQNAIARKEKSFNSLSSGDERSYRRGQRSPRQSSSIINDTTKNIQSKSLQNNNKINKSLKTYTLSSLSENKMRSPTYDDKLQCTIDQLKSTLEQSSNHKQSKCDSSDNSEELLQTECVINKEICKTVEDEEVINEMTENIIDKKKNDNKVINNDNNKTQKQFYGRAVKRKSRYFKGLKYTFKGGHIKNSNRTWSMTRRRKYDDKLLAKEQKQHELDKDDEEEEEEEEGEEEEEEEEEEGVVEEEEEEEEAVDEDEDQKKQNLVDSNNTIEEDSNKENSADIDAKRMSSIFGVGPSEDIDNTVADNSVVSNSDDVDNNVDTSSETNTNTFNISSSSGVKRKLNLEANDGGEDEVVEKKLREGCESPNIAEVVPTEDKNELPVLSAATLYCAEEAVFTKVLCLCNSKELYYASPSSCRSELYCQAIDSLDGRLIGCCNTVSVSAARLVRASIKLPYLVLCNIHHQRIRRHNCCPGCGNFCTQGQFVQCKFGHHYHKDCQNVGPPQTNFLSAVKEDKLDELAPVCLHCGSDSFYDVNISLGAHKYPVFLPLQKPPKEVPSAKMTFSGCYVDPVEVKYEDEDVEDKKFNLVDDKDKPLVPPVNLVLPSGLKISSEGLPDTGLKDKLDKLLHVACTITTPPSGRYTLRNMYQAAKSGDAEKLIYMLASGLNPNHQFREWVMGTSLHAACYGGHITVVHLLIQAGSDIDILDKEQNTPLMISVLNKHNDIVKYLVKVGADVTFKGGDGMTALHLAAKTGNIEACHYLLSNLNVPRFFIDTVDDGRWTPLVWAAEHCHTDVVRFLLNKRADPLVRDAEQNIALHWAALAGSVEISEALLNFGSAINSTNAHGDTALHIAARQNAYSCTVLLLSRGARVDLRNRAGFTPVECCLLQDCPTYNVIKLNLEIKTFNKSKRISRILTNDITRGHEVNPVQCVNAVDDEGIPQDFTYIIENCFTSNINVDRTITSLQFCKCRDSCTTGCCTCGKISIRCWYDNDGRLLPEFNFADPPMLFECNRACMCNKVTCKNRVVQHGIKARFQLFKTTTNKGWGVRTLRLIQKGSYVCEYIGEIISDCEADTREDDSYLFDLDNRDGETYCIDARKYGNIARFINHMCVPNLLPVRVFIDHQDLHFPRIAFFANRDIQVNEELGFDYGEKFWIIKCKSFTCTCGAEKCRYSETSIQQTLENYQKKLQQEDSSSQ